MNALWNWLLELCDLDRVPTVEEGAAALTRGGLEVEGVTDLGAGFSGVVVAEVVSKRKHPNADTLNIVSVITERGGAATEVVCGAPNVPEPGWRVLWAQPGATLPGGITLAPKAIKGVTSPGMLCSEIELGIGDDDNGIVVFAPTDTVVLGDPAQKALGVDDWMLEISAPANRGDVLGHLGLARELCAVLGGRLVPPSSDLTAVTTSALRADGVVSIGISDASLCPRYVARVIDGVTVGPSPRKLAQRLRGVGVRPISNLVDVTNYVMFELGQPLHAFDAGKLRGAHVGVRPAGDGTRFATLDGVERTLLQHDLVIVDGEGPIALAGVMGGLSTEVDAGTRRVLLESASFLPLAVRRTARRLALHSESSLRFERGVDPELAEMASARAALLLAQLGGGQVADGVVDSYPGKKPPVTVSLRLSRIQRLTGMDVTEATCRGALGRLGFEVAGAGETMRVTPPSARADVVREVDVIEEIVRMIGFDDVPTRLPPLTAAPPVQKADRLELVRRALTAGGLSEAITFGFQSLARLEGLRLSATDRRAQPIALRNPMSADQAIMRTSLVPNLLAAVRRNAGYGRPDVAMFEVGSVFLRKSAMVTDAPPAELADEPPRAAVVLTGRRPAQIGDGAPWDLFDAKGFAEAAIRAVAGDVAIQFIPATDVSFLHPGLAAKIIVEGETVGVVGEIHPQTRRAFDLEVAAYAVELCLDQLPLAPPAQMRPIARFPGSSRDVSLLLDDAIVASKVGEVIGRARQPLVEQVRLMEEYRGERLPAGKKSMLWSIGYRAGDRTLTDAEVDAAHESIVAALMAELPAQRR